MPHVKRRANLFLFVMVISIFLLCAALILLLTQRPAFGATAHAVGLPAGATCEVVREKVAEHGRAVALAWAIKQGYSLSQIAAARRCLSTK